ncbi:B12-binding domain-containing radical SAM protein [candidate division CSSED10-310 bacterium]|uniref:B12-binding domain-containing radical SAM protein n=1 Tax=candidate division CSSED10-310 bacterium TaxID=2855610 RepID=A0ABV6Z188_UNCC1
MDLSFIDPPVLIGKRTPERVFGCTYGLYPIPNIFLLQVAALAKNKNCHVQYRNFPLEKANRRSFITFLLNHDADMYALYSVNLARQIDLEALNLIRQHRGNRPVVFFGPAPTYNPEDYLKDEHVIVVRGEPEATFSELIDVIQAGKNYDQVPGISALKEGKVYHNPNRALNIDLDSLPYPARELIDAQKYFNPKFGQGKFTAMLTSRGCPYQCTFCVPCSLSFAREIEYKNNHDSKPRYVARSAANVIAEFMALKQQGYTSVAILDDEFVVNRKRVIEICQGIKKLAMKWGCLARADTLNEKVIKEMSEAGCAYIDIGVESFNQKILDDIQKKLKVETIEQSIKLAKKYGIFTKINILFGSSPLEDKNTIEETILNIKQLKPDAVMFGICNPFPGTEYYSVAKQNGWFVRGDYYPIDVQKESTISLPLISKKQLEYAVRKANLNFFLRPGFVINNIRRIRSPRELVNKISALAKKLF